MPGGPEICGFRCGTWRSRRLPSSLTWRLAWPLPMCFHNPPSRSPERPNRAPTSELIDRVEIAPDRHADPYFWAPAGCETRPASGKPAPDAPPAPTHEGDTGWLFMANRGAAFPVFGRRSLARAARWAPGWPRPGV